jgi:pilus assembly protein CpaF
LSTVGALGGPAGDLESLARQVQLVLVGRQVDEAHQAPGPELVARLVAEQAPLLDATRAARVTQLVLARILGLGPLEELMADPDTTDVMVNGGGRVWVDRAGRLVATDITLDEPATLHLIERVLAPLGRHVDRANPIVDARLPDGSRVHAVVRPLAVDGPCLTIRRFGARPITLAEVCTPGTAALLAWAVQARSNLVVSGGAGAGKTTLLNALAGAIPPGERVITIEDAAELRLPGDHVVRLESRPASTEGVGQVRVRDLVRAALRMRPDRIVVGEVRAGEALDMLQAMNTGHEGSLSTCHANGPVEAVARLETMVLMGDVELPHAAVREQVVSAVDLVVHIARHVDGGRRVGAVSEVGAIGADGRVGLRLLADGSGVMALPARPPRSGLAGDAHPDWIGR